MSDNKIAVDGISKGFGDLSAVSGVSFDVRDSEFVAIVGPSGCGKSTLLITHDVEEAIYLADRVLVLPPHPTTIQTTFHMDLPHPRKLSDPKAQDLREAILKELGL